MPKTMYGRAHLYESGGFSFSPGPEEETAKVAKEIEELILDATTEKLPIDGWGFLDSHSERELRGVSSKLERVVRHAEDICAQKFGVHDGMLGVGAYIHYC